MKDALIKKIKDKEARVGIVGLGYVGLPLAAVHAMSGFKTMGFDPKELSFGYEFEYEDLHYLFLPSDNDEKFLSLALPAVLNFNDEEHPATYEMMDELNSTIKYVKASRIHDAIWLFYERELQGNEDLEALLTAMIMALEAALINLHGQVRDAENDDEEEDEEE